jgi:CubicO group peptidase (beta-lactamase class C family)
MVYKQPDFDIAAAPPESIPEQFREAVAAMLDPDSLYSKAFSITDPAGIDFNSPEVQASEIPASNGIGTARAVARMYAALISEVDGVRLLTPETVAAATREQSVGVDRVLLVPTRFGSGYALPTDVIPMTGPTSFGHPGRGGSLGFADPEHGIAFGYVMNHIIEDDPNDARAPSLVDAVRTSLA